MAFFRLRVLVIATWILSAAAGCNGGCSCLAPLPAPVPTDQVIEGGAQIRVTPAGFTTLTSIVPGLVNNLVSQGFCLPGPVGIFDIFVADVDICHTNDQCGGGQTGCKVGVKLDDLQMSVPDAQTFRVDARFDVSVPVTVIADWFGPLLPDSKCTLTVTLNDAHGVADIGFGIDPADGELTVALKGVQALDISNLNISGCSVLGTILNAVVGFVADLVSTQVGTFIVNALTPVLNGFLQGLLPDPLGIEGVADLGSFLGGIAPGVNAALEVKGVPGGYVSLPSQGLSVGMVLGINSDQDPTTRTPELDNESARCVPLRQPPNYEGLLPRVDARGTYALRPAGEFLGQPDGASDIVVGLSETVMDQAGFHVVNSGAACLGVGTSLVPQINLGVISILIGSIADLAEASGTYTGQEPVLLVIRPQEPFDFKIGTGTASDPRIGIGVTDMEVDFYVFLYERYVRAFTVSMTLNLGINLDFTLNDQGQPAIQPMLLGLEPENIFVKVSNTDFLEETSAQLESVFPAVFDLVVPLLGDALGAIALPAIEGFTLGDLQFAKIITNEDDFLAIYANLAVASAKQAQLIEDGRRFLPPDFQVKHSKPYRALDTTARLVEVRVPSPGTIRDALVRDRLSRHAGEGLPEIELELGSDAPIGTPLEWSWRLNGGMWHDWSSVSRPVLREKGFALQGRHTLEVRVRQQGDFRTFDKTPVVIPLVIDSAPPSLLEKRTRVVGSRVEFAALDQVTAAADLAWGFGAPADEDPADWRRTGSIEADELAALSHGGEGGLVRVFLRDEKGNVSREDVDLKTIVGFHGQPPPASSGCDCRVGTGSSSPLASTLGGLLALLAIVPLAGRRRLRGALACARRAAPQVLLVLVFSLPACDCSSDNPGEDGTDSAECTLDTDCDSMCDVGQVGVCSDGQCSCADDLPRGIAGAHSDLAVAPDGAAWISAWNQSYGDLVVARVTTAGRVPDEAWVYVDGVPDGPVAVPDSEVRGGIRELGDNVGRYTSIAVGPDGNPMVAYYDVDHASLKVARFDGSAWTAMVVDAGQPIAEEIGGADLGRYASLTIGSDGKAGVAYLAVLDDSGVRRSELRYALAKVTAPASAGDWDVLTIDSRANPPPAEGETPVEPELPDAVSLFITSARLPDGAPIVAYYDRLDGDLKIAQYELATLAFKAPEVLDGADGTDVGLYPSIIVDDVGAVHLSYVDATHDNLLYVNLADRVPEVVDDGYRIDGQNADGLDRPVFHFIGDDSSIVSIGGQLAVAYQDATSHALCFARRGSEGWTVPEVVAGDEDPFVGGYGFYAAAEGSGADVLMSTWVVDNVTYDFWVEVFRVPAVID